MRVSVILTQLLFLSVSASYAMAQETDRFTLERSGDNFVRMDRQTGEMSICQERSGQLVCKLAADERSAFEKEVDALEQRVMALDERVVKLETSRAVRLDEALPSDEQIDRTVETMGKFLRGFMGIMKDLDKETGGQAPSADPQKT